MRPAVAPLALTVVAVLVGCGSEGDGAGSEPSDLEGISWVLAAGIDVDGWEAAPPSASFEAGRVGGFTGCNSYGADYTDDGSALDLGEVAMTLIGCPAPAGDVETAFLRALERVAAWRVEAGELILFGAGDEELLRFEVATPVGSWRVVDHGEFDRLVEGVQMTATFTEDGLLRGGAGCNTYRATYTSDGNAIEITRPAATKKYCAMPEGVMEQEAAYLQALASAARFRVDGNTLQLSRADGTPVVSFGRSRP